MELTTHLHPLPWLRTVNLHLQFSYMFPWCAQGQIYLFIGPCLPRGFVLFVCSKIVTRTAALLITLGYIIFIFWVRAFIKK